MLDEDKITENKNFFLTTCKKNIGREGLCQLLNWLENSDFFIAPSSSRFHGNYKGGLCEHSINVYNALLDLVDMTKLQVYSLETLTIAALFHDLCKVSYYKPSTRNVKIDGVWQSIPGYEVDEKVPLGHGEKSCMILQQYITLTVDELLAIRWHMGAFDYAVKGGDNTLSRAQDKCKLVSLLHIADMIASSLMETTYNPLLIKT